MLLILTLLSVTWAEMEIGELLDTAKDRIRCVSDPKVNYVSRAFFFPSLAVYGVTVILCDFFLLSLNTETDFKTYIFNLSLQKR